MVVELTEPSDQDDVPVILHNNKFVEPVESVVESYSLPGKGEMDPSGAVAMFYYVLFGLMLSGCGLRPHHDHRLYLLSEKNQKP